MMNLMAEETKSSGMEQGLKLTGQRSEENRIAEENIMLKEENQWMHKTIWELLQKNKALEFELENHILSHHSQDHFESDRII